MADLTYYHFLTAERKAGRLRPDEAMDKPLIIALQTALTELGFDPNGIDGWAGTNTRRAAADYLAARKIRDTPMPIVFAGAAKRLDDFDLPVIGARIGVGEDEIHAVIDVETAGGGGFDDKGRVRMLFEPHVFYRELGAGSDRDRAVAAGLAYPRWGERVYPRDSYRRLLAAIAIDEGAALRSASWGLGQIMGFNALLAGYPDARAMVNAFVDDEEHHLTAMVAFITSSGLDDELRRHDWRGFARGYNGASYASHGYHTKLAAAYAKWARIPDTIIPEAA